MSSPMFIALINTKSGGNVGSYLLSRFKEILDEERVYNINADGGPGRALKEHLHTENLRIIACGGDGTVGWILSEMDKLSYPDSACIPSIGIIPLGTGNDLSRSLNWGGKYRDKPLRKVLLDIAKADVVDLDRWSLLVTPRDVIMDDKLLDEDDLMFGTVAKSDDNLPLNVVNNYFSVGIDAHIALQFHKARNNNPEHFTSRTRNLLFYGLEGGKDLFKQQWRNLMNHVRIVCDGEDFTDKLKAYGAHSVLFLNIKSYAGGTKPWNRKNGTQDIADGLLEVVAMDNLDLAILHAGGSGTSVCQCREAVITSNKPLPMQIDGEPCMMRPCQIVIRGLGSKVKMLARNKTATYAVKDAEIENWAAKKIQRSFKEYKYNKSLSQELMD
ncbi:eye-specific diacylglycerol kinase isoform X2 [Lepeophtheirus salmonis]|uniref:Diacylglycerol kinase n=1 Tax=Lepeophtheirus salmonis TaxID=72036 RepID=A0A0K2U1B0_LEPSM|nr:eye-specific diacylglycerol kinase-like isoform X2 [Lepeophtheirus salmonis]